MNFTKTLLAPTLFVALAAGTALPAFAARYGSGNQLRHEISQLNQEIYRARNDNVISRREATSLLAEVQNLNSTWRTYARGGFNRGETRSLDNRIGRVKRDLARQATDRNSRADNRYGNDHRR